MIGAQAPFFTRCKMEVVYLPMPVSFEEKREWNAKGFKVVDEVYKPKDEEPKPEVKPKKAAK